MSFSIRPAPLGTISSPAEWMQMATSNALQPRTHLFLPGLETFYLSPKHAGSEASNSSCSVAEANDFGVNISNNFQSELTRLDMVSALDWLENLDSEQIPELCLQQNQQGKKARPDLDLPATVSFPSPPGMTKERYQKVEAEINFPNGDHFQPKEHFRREQTVFHCRGEFPRREMPKESPTARQFWPDELPNRETRVVQTRSQDEISEHFRPEVTTTQNGSHFLLKQRSPHEPEVTPTGSRLTHKGKPANPIGNQCPYSGQEDKNDQKRRRKSVPDECKDARYWRTRSRNNLSAKKSRAAKRVKDMFIANKIQQLEQENSVLKGMLANVMMQLQQKQQLQHHYNPHLKQQQL